jgi:hypothetical protein
VIAIPEHFVPTSDNPQWRGKIKCAYCSARGWRYDGFPKWWGHKHGASCKRRPDLPGSAA